MADVNKKYVRTEMLTITRTEEVSLVDEKSTDKPAIGTQIVLGAWKLIKKYMFSFKWMGGKDDG